MTKLDKIRDLDRQIRDAKKLVDDLIAERVRLFGELDNNDDRFKALTTDVRGYRGGALEAQEVKP